MISFLEEVEQSLPAGLVLPDEFRSLFDWMEANGFVHQYKRSGERYASLYPAKLEDVPERPIVGITAPHRGGSLVTFHAAYDAHFVEAWTGNKDPEVAGRLAIFINTGGDGSQAGLWKNDEGRQVFVHVGSGSGSTMVSTLADNPVDMLRLLAIGYQELCWPEEFTTPPTADEDGNYLPPTQFRKWVETSFGVTIPITASEIVSYPAEMGDETSDDAFCRWITKHSPNMT